jgi:prepilin-type N-terminal cleavage/methylation domain-containing protein
MQDGMDRKRQLARHLLGRALPTRRRRGLTLFECLLALMILLVAVLAVTSATTIGHQHLQAGDDLLRAVECTRNLMDEIASRPYAGVSGGARSTWHIDDYHGFAQAIGAMTDFTGAPCEVDHFGWAVTVAATDHTVADLDGAMIPGKTITITVSDAQGPVSELTQFIAEETP